MASAKKSLLLYRGTDQWRIKYYVGTSQEELKATIRDVCNIPINQPFLLLDEDGDSVTLSSTAMPEGISLFIQMVDALPKPAVIPQLTNGEAIIYWTWDLTSSSCEKLQMKDDGLTVGLEPGHGLGWICIWSTIEYGPTVGIQVYSLLFNPLDWCSGCNLFSSLSDELTNPGNFSQRCKKNTVLDKELFVRTCARDCGGHGHDNFVTGSSRSVELIYVLDMAQRTLRIFKKGEKKPRLLISNVPDRLRPFCTFKYPAWITITGFGKALIEQNELDLHALPVLTEEK
ncbi:unnamed protein product [Rotaria socialis]|uniref:PB1 domain-containing protein n=1 Tax=Rotaria socialis TaxID=392032 RepID=A0A821TRZ0_9BILA|nr:unnamed protein product [Rotaria socialis]CAF4878756.1 unnamed protein product [Rotaria socialis]